MPKGKITVKELIGWLSELDDQNAEIVLSTGEEGNEFYSVDQILHCTEVGYMDSDVYILFPSSEERYL